MTYPKNWIIKSLKDWGMQAQSGFASGVHNSEGHGVIHLRPMNVSRLGKLDFETFKSVADNSARRIQKGDILFNNTNSAELVGKTAVVDVEGDFAFSNHMTRLRFPEDKVDHTYMAILLHSFWMSGYFNEICSNHVNQASVSIKRLEQVEVPLPPIKEQLKIVEHLEDHLSRLDVALGDVMQAKIKAAQFRRSLLQAAFTGNLGSNGTCRMSEWKTQTVGEIAETQLGKMLNKSKQTGENTLSYLRSKNVQWGRIDLSDLNQMDILPNELEKFTIKKGDLLICEGGESGRVAIWDKEEPIGFQNALHRVRSKNEVTNKFLYYYFEWLVKNQLIEHLFNGVTIKHFPQENLRSVEITYPTIDQQHKIVEILEDHLSRLEAAVSLTDTIEKQSTVLRRSLLQAAFTGQLTKEVAIV